MLADKKIEQLNDKWLRLIGIPVVTCLLTFSFGISMLTIFHQPVIKVFCTYFILSLIYWESCRLIILITRKKFPGIEQTSKRIVAEVLSVIMLVALLSISTTYFFDKTTYWGFEEMTEDYFYYFGFNLIYMLMVAAIYESIYFFRTTVRSLNLQNELKKINVQVQLDSLKNQINPHFLFNSLNSLSSLIEENADAAKDFVNELSDVYRYILMSGEKQLSSLKEELEFINAYFFLLKTRHGEYLKTEINVDKKYLDFKIPPLTLQILFENAAKHNSISASSPLVIKIHNAEDNLITIENNLQKRKQIVVSNKVGLTNIKKRYEILGANGMKVEQLENNFSVSVPLIELDDSTVSKLNV